MWQPLLPQSVKDNEGVAAPPPTKREGLVRNVLLSCFREKSATCIPLLPHTFMCVFLLHTHLRLSLRISGL